MSDLIGFGQNDGKLINNGRLQKYKGKENYTDRIALVWFFQDDDGEYLMSPGDAAAGIDADTPKFEASLYHYVDGLGYIKPKGDYTIQRFGAPKRRAGTYVIKYNTDRQGTPKKPLSYELMEWQISSNKYQKLAAIHSEFPLVYHDLKVTCDGEQYQKLSFSPCNGEALWRRVPEMKEEILAAVKEQGGLSLARDLPLEEIKAHLGDVPNVVGDGEDDTDFDDLLSDLG